MFSLRSLFEVIETYVDRACYAPMTKEYNGPLRVRTSCNETPIDAHTYKNLPCHRLEFRKWRELAPACFQEEASLFGYPNTPILALKQHIPLPSPLSAESLSPQGAPRFRGTRLPKPFFHRVLHVIWRPLTERPYWGFGVLLLGVATPRELHRRRVARM